MSMHKYFVEFLGTLFLMYTIFATGNWLAIGAALAIAILAGSAISGGAYNPAVTLALNQAGKLSDKDVIPYIVAQVFGAICAFYIYKKI